MDLHSDSVFEAGSRANHRALVELRETLGHAGFRVVKKINKEHTLRAYPGRLYTYPLLNPRLVRRTVRGLTGRFFLEISAWSRGDDRVGRHLRSYRSTTESKYVPARGDGSASIRGDSGELVLHGSFYIRLRFREAPDLSPDLNALGVLLKELREFSQGPSNSAPKPARVSAKRLGGRGNTWEVRLAALFKTSIYVNASSKRLLAASRGIERSDPIVENKRWTTGVKLIEQARQRGEELPLVFSHYPDLTFWAVASDITLHENTTEYRFRNLQRLRGYRRRHLVVESTAAALSDQFIRSYALVRTPAFLGVRQHRKGHQAGPRPLKRAKSD